MEQVATITISINPEVQAQDRRMANTARTTARQAELHLLDALQAELSEMAAQAKADEEGYEPGSPAKLQTMSRRLGLAQAIRAVIRAKHERGDFA